MWKSEGFIAVVIPFAFCRRTMDIVAHIGHGWMRNSGLLFGLKREMLRQPTLLQL